MNKLVLLFGCVLIGSTAIAEEQQSAMAVAVANSKTDVIEKIENRIAALNFNTEPKEAHSSFDKQPYEGPYTLNINEIEFIDEDFEIDLGFDPYDYLPENFDPYKTYINMEAIPFIDEQDETDLGFDTAKYLPEGFDAYEGGVTLSSLNFIEEEDYNLGFNVADYLPEGYSPYEVYFDINSIIYIEDEELDIEIVFPPSSSSNFTIEPSK